MRHVLDILRLIRAVNCLMAMAGVWVGGYLTWLQPVYTGPLLTGLATFLVCAAGNIVNDLVDINSDRLNHPDRMLVQGRVSERLAVILASSFAAVALILGAFVNLTVLATIALALGLLAAYNFGGKNLPVVGNLIVGILGGLTFMIGGFAVDPMLAWVLPGPLIPAAFGVLFHFVREIVKDVHDIEGDRAVGSGSIPVVFGVRAALSTALALFLVLVVLTLIPVVTGWFGEAYKIIVIYMVDLPLLALLIFIWGKPSTGMLLTGSAALKLGMALGVVALLVA